MKTLVAQSSWCNRKRSRGFSRQRFANKNHGIETKSLISVKVSCSPIRAVIKKEFLHQELMSEQQLFMIDSLLVFLYTRLVSNIKADAGLSHHTNAAVTLSTHHFTIIDIRTDFQRFTANITACKHKIQGMQYLCNI